MWASKRVSVWHSTVACMYEQQMRVENAQMHVTLTGLDCPAYHAAHSCMRSDVCTIAGERLLSTMLVSILRTQHIWRIKQYYFGRWNKYASGRRAKLQAIRASLGRALRARLLHRVAPAFKLWRRVAHYKQLERSRV